MVRVARVVRCVGLWSVLGFALNLTWETAHVRLYTLRFEADGMTIARAVFHCSLGDVVIALGSFALAGVLLMRIDWPQVRPLAGCLIVMIAATAFTAWSEWYNVYRVGAWSYTPDMSTVYGIGLSPLLQWVIIPPVLVAGYKALMRSVYPATAN